MISALFLASWSVAATKCGDLVCGIEPGDSSHSILSQPDSSMPDGRMAFLKHLYAKIEVRCVQFAEVPFDLCTCARIRRLFTPIIQLFSDGYLF